MNEKIFSDIRMTMVVSFVMADQVEEGGRTGSRTDDDGDQMMTLATGYASLTERPIEVLRYLHEDSEITYPKLSQKMGITVSAVQKHINALKETGTITRVGTYGGKWIINYNPE